MTTTQHTPGPWHVGGKGNQIVFAADGLAIANATVHHGKHEGQSEANARLIAAAPETAAERDRLKADLLEICKLWQTMTGGGKKYWAMCELMNNAQRKLAEVKP